MQVARRAEFRRQRGHSVAAFLLRVPDQSPPALVGGEMRGVFRRARVGHLRPLFVTDARVQMQAPRGALPDDFNLVINQPFGNTDPVAEIAAQFERLETLQQPARDPWIEQDAPAMRFVRDADAPSLLHGQGRLKEAAGFAFTPRIQPAMGVDKDRRHARGFAHLPAEGFDVRRHAGAGGENLRDELELVSGQQAAQRAALAGRGQRGFDAAKAQLSELREEFLPVSRDTPQMAYEQQFHSCFNEVAFKRYPHPGVQICREP